MPISTIWILKYVQQCYGRWFWTISSLGAPVLRRLSTLLEDLDVDFVLQYFILCLFVNEDDDETELHSYQRVSLSVFESFIAVNS